MLLDDPVRGVDAAQALFRNGEHDAALAMAMRWFDSTADATARQIAATIHLTRNEHAVAQALFEHALAGHLRTGDHREAARDAQLLAGTLMYQERFRDSLDAAKLGVREADRAGDQQLAAYASLALGKILAEIGDATRARTAYWEARERASRYPDARAWIYLELGMLEYDTGHGEDSAKLLEFALELARAQAIPSAVTAALLNLARVERDLGHVEAADTYMHALDVSQRDMPTVRLVAGLIAADHGDRAEANRLLALAAADSPTDDYAIDIAVQRGKLAEAAGDVAQAEGFYRQAIALLDKLQAANSLELRPWVLTHRREAYGALLAVLAHADRRDAALEIAAQLHARTWQDAFLGYAGPKDSAVRTAMARTIREDLRLAADPASSRDRLRSILARRELLIVSDTGVDVWRFHVVDGVVERLDRVPAEITALVDQWRARPDDMVLAARLGAALVPAAVYRPAIRPIYIVADGRLGALPFEALRYEDHYLVERRVVVRVPDVLALRCHPADRAPRSALFLGDSRNNLSFARSEVMELAVLLRGDAFVGDQVTLDRLASGRNATLLHLALHADATGSGPSLLLSRGSISSADLVAMKLSPRLAVLAGCATAVSRDIEGWDALSSAFLVNGTPTVVATLQSVADADAAVILRRFYELGGEQHPAVALAMAQRELLRAGKISTWAPYAAYGAADAADCEPAKP